ncbi:MAG TPA: aminoglycoside 3'-phosphotransferase [Caulobacteraceae bacterium]|nr:aminoglycoside 3'-phosphotransferase [Caulobacteraceae bacterium]
MATAAVGEGMAEVVDQLCRAAGLPPPTSVQSMSHGMSGDLVLRLEGPRPFFAKIGDPARRISVDELTREVGMLRWLDGRAGGARVIWSGDVAGRPAMLTEAIAGVALHDLAPDRAEAGAVAALAALAALHALPIADCPFDARLDVRLAEAARRVAAGEVDVANLAPHNAGRDLADVWRAFLDRRPPSEDLAVTHGDACWPNLIWRPDGGVGLIDLGRAGVADRCQDLALFIRSARHNVPDLPIETIVAAHYPTPLDAEKLEFYRELDEFF